MANKSKKSTPKKSKKSTNKPKVTTNSVKATIKNTDKKLDNAASVPLISNYAPVVGTAGVIFAFLFVFFWYPKELFSMPIQNYDSPFHFYAIKNLLDNGLGALFQIAPGEQYYPPLFHFLSYLFIQIPTLFGASMAIGTGTSFVWILSMGILFPAGMTKLTIEIMKDKGIDISQNPFVFTIPLIAVSFSSFPYEVLNIGTLYAYGFAVCFLPWVLLYWRRLMVRFDFSQKNIIWLIVILLCVLLSPPRAMFLILPLFVIDFILNIKKMYRYNKTLGKWTVIVAIISGLSTIAIVAYYVSTHLRSDLLYHPENWFQNINSSGNPIWSLMSWLGASAMLENTFDGVSTITLVITFFAFIFCLVTCIYRRSMREFVIAFIFFGLIYLCTTSFDNGFANIVTAPFYKNTWRITPILPIIVTPMVAYFVATISNILQRKIGSQTALLFGLFCTTTLLLTPLVNQENVSIAKMVSGQALIEPEISNTLAGENKNKLITTQKVELFMELQKNLPKDSYVITDPFAGGNYLYSLANVKVVYPIYNFKLAGTKEESILQALSSYNDEQILDNVCTYKDDSKNYYLLRLGKYSPMVYDAGSTPIYEILRDNNLTTKMLESGTIKLDSEYASGQGSKFKLYKFNCGE
ncbi:MAG: hypothetical protein LBN03_00630 [Bifidobacteriaceae bacterium]|jgi:hypothetical protein|nr:hypothetical protein [Bifidobacteriaceae bacterium]